MSIRTTHKNESQQSAEDALKTMRKLSQGEELSEDEQKAIDQATRNLQEKTSAVANKPMNRAQKRAAQKLAAKQAQAGARAGTAGTAAATAQDKPQGAGNAQQNQSSQQRGLSEQDMAEMTDADLQNHLVEQLQSQGRGVFREDISDANLSAIYEVYDSFETPDEDEEDWSSEEAAKLLIDELAKKDIPAEISSNQHRRAKYGLNKEDNAQVVIAHFHGPVIARVGDEKYILTDFFEELIVPKSAVPESEVEATEEKPKKSLFKRKKNKKN